MNNDSLFNMRTEYKSKELSVQDFLKDPMEQFQKWFNEAENQTVPEPNAFALSTVNASQQPSTRIVLVKQITHEGIIFFTNYDSKKGKEITQNPFVSACFFWQPLFRQVRFEGVCKKISEEASNDYFNQRPYGSQIGAIASPQSEVIPSREWLLNQWDDTEKEQGKTPTRPKNWGGYIIQPTLIEFWQGQPSRLHDRFQYTLQNDGNWTIDRLAP